MKNLIGVCDANEKDCQRARQWRLKFAKKRMDVYRLVDGLVFTADSFYEMTSPSCAPTFSLFLPFFIIF